jgi:hypothetical protein
MGLTKLTKDIDYIQKLSDLPNEIDGLDSNELKERFDQAGDDIKDFINNTLIAELDTALSSIPSVDGFVRTDDSRLSDSRKCNNTFDNWNTARTNLKIGYGTTLPSSADNGSIFFLYK